MRNYQLYIIEDEFAAHYFGRERMFFQLFKEFAYAEGERENILGKQVQYITKEIPMMRVQQILKRQLTNRRDFKITNNYFSIEMADFESHAKMLVNDRFLHIQANGSYEAEVIFFEVLRKWEKFFLAVDFENDRYGWLKPIKERKFILKNEKQILYNDASFSTL